MTSLSSRDSFSSYTPVVIPSTDCELSYFLPAGKLWTPSGEELRSDEGFGGFRDTWPIWRVGIREARAMIELEREVISCVATAATTEETFDEVLRAIEGDDTEALEQCLPDTSSRPPCLDRFVDTGTPLGNGLDLGVAGLVYAVAAVGCFPAASCRGHPGNGAWSSIPLVRLAASRPRALVLLELAKRTECGCALEGDLLSLWAGSVEAMMALAAAVLDARPDFAAAVRRGPRRARPPSTQLSLEI